MSELSDRLRDGGAGTSTAVGNGVGSDGSGSRGAESKGNGAVETTAVDAARRPRDLRPPADAQAGSPGAGSPGDMQGELAALRHKVDLLAGEVDYQQRRTTILESNVAARDGRIGQQEYLLADLNADNAQLRHRNAQLEREGAARDAWYEQELADRDAEKAQLQEQLAERDAEIAWLRQNLGRDNARPAGQRADNADVVNPDRSGSAVKGNWAEGQRQEASQGNVERTRLPSNATVTKHGNRPEN